MQPSLFISHGSPMLALTPGPAHDFLRELGRALRPEAILVVSAHWTTRQLMVSTSPRPETIHDFGGFPQALFDCQYPAPGEPELARRFARELNAVPTERGLDHGAWVPLSLMFPEADIPVVSLSLPVEWSNQQLVELGGKLAGARCDGVLVIGSGSLTHNLAEMQAGQVPTPEWVSQFVDWIHFRLEAGDRDALQEWELAPQARRNHPTPEHFLPLLVAMGAGGQARRLHHSVEQGVLTMDVYAFA
ncbi:dioxygenase [Halomonas sp. DQ26W]|uniref:dioxygenase family protein n=1 Tax=Halomonas sp. DQ26W TaxID=2282311 RepID=UPI000DF84C51|nr:class III extradiol ring-cleavage dioxygenase [Halomonas sp. DQ26W]RDB44335.1 dioxygenase [Halomonas sp. DQ26W]